MNEAVFDEPEAEGLEAVIDEVIELGEKLGAASDHYVEAVLAWIDSHPDASPNAFRLLGRFLLLIWHDDFAPEWMGRDLWLKAFRAVGFANDDDRVPPKRSLVIYRGATERDRLGMSWSTSRAWATGHAQKRWDEGLGGSAPGPRKVWRAVIPPAGVLARLDVPPEHEVVVDPSFLRGVEELDGQ